MQFKESRFIVDRRHSNRSLIHIGHIGEHSTVSRMITKLIGMVDSVTSPLQTQPGQDIVQKGNSELPNQDIKKENETMKEMMLSEQAEMSDTTDNTASGSPFPDINLTEKDHQSEDDSGMEQPAISDLAAIAGEFNAAFNTALYELDTSRKQLVERAVRIVELNESIETISGTLNDEVNKGNRKEEEYSRETEQLNKKISDIESDRERLLQQANEQESTLNARAEEIGQLSSRVKEVTDKLEQRTAEGQHAQEEFVRERNMLTNKFDELQVLFDEAGSQLNAQQKELEDRDSEITGISKQVDNLTTELDSMVEASGREKDVHNQEVTRLGTAIQDLSENLKTSEQQHEKRSEELELKGKEAAWLNDHVNELKEEVEAHSESMRAQSESHASTCDKLNGQINNISGELESLQAAHSELGTHAENLENLNRALHDSSSSEKTLHKKLIEEKTNKIESLQTRLGSANESQDAQSAKTEENENLQKVLSDIESRLQETEAQNQILGERAQVADQLEAEAGQLRTALQEARDNGSPDTQSLHEQLADLNSALENSRAEQEALAGELRDHEALKQEVASLKEAAQQADNKLLEQADVSTTVDSLREEIEKLKSALSASEMKSDQLQTAIPTASLPDESDIGGTPAPVQYPPSVSKTTDREQFALQLNNLLVEEGASNTNRTVMYVLLDNFIRIRDEIGIMNSEQVISEISEIIKSYCNDDDLISRFGDCTFAILSSNEDIDKTQGKAEKICSKIEHHIFEASEHSMVTTTSIGICRVRKNDTSAEEVISRADLACEAARSSGGNQVLVSSAIADEAVLKGSSENHHELVSATLSENRIMIYYQPISSLKDAPGNHYEVLIRIVDESGNIILPGEFFSMAEVSGQTVDVDRYVIEKIMQMLAESPDQGMSLFIKLTKQSVADHELPLWIIGKIKEYKINPEQLVFEIAENTLQNDLKNLSMLSKALNSIGCKVAIEHYRMSTQAQHLLHIHTDYLKIDSGLIEGLSRKGGSLSKVTAIMEVARKHNYITVAEGVENPASLAILWELGVSLAQGYFIQAPTGNRDYDFHGAESESESETEDNNRATFTTT